MVVVVEVAVVLFRHLFSSMSTLKYFSFGNIVFSEDVLPGSSRCANAGA